MHHKLITLLFLLLLGSSALQAREVITFSAAPTHGREAATRIYTPLVEYLSEVTGMTVQLDAPANFIEYSTRMRLDRYDMLFDGPHLAGWRIDLRNHEPVARLPGQIRFVLVGPQDSPVQSIYELERATERVCAFASPNLLTLAFLSYFPNPARQPMMLRVQGFDELESCLRSGRGEVAVMRDGQWNNMDQTGLRLIDTQREAYPERTFTISKDIDPQVRERIREAMLSEEGQQRLRPMLEAFNRDRLNPAPGEDYKGLGALLAPVWGFH